MANEAPSSNTHRRTNYSFPSATPSSSFLHQSNTGSASIADPSSTSEPLTTTEEEAPVIGDDEDTGAQVAPIVKLEEVAVTTGEENEDAILDLKSKLYRFDKDGNQWKERGVGTVKFLKHKATGKKDNERE
ncbi:ran-binding protein 1 homolog c [Lathyrus oleraceus]|uniref:ran-binding protein 1 homolog c n=1 Tax=Pisum sativum TaxID=3888 RepID=UPI0021CEBE3B|nr:ran-binding protein 1 homolog c-like [Pisum sativum]